MANQTAKRAATLKGWRPLERPVRPCHRHRPTRAPHQAGPPGRAFDSEAHEVGRI